MAIELVIVLLFIVAYIPWVQYARLLSTQDPSKDNHGRHQRIFGGREHGSEKTQDDAVNSSISRPIVTKLFADIGKQLFPTMVAKYSSLQTSALKEMKGLMIPVRGADNDDQNRLRFDDGTYESR